MWDALNEQQRECLGQTGDQASGSMLELPGKLEFGTLGVHRSVVEHCKVISPIRSGA